MRKRRCREHQYWRNNVKLDPGRRDGAAQSDGSPVVTTAWLAFGLAGLALTVAEVSLGLTIYQLRSPARP